MIARRRLRIPRRGAIEDLDATAVHLHHRQFRRLLPRRFPSPRQIQSFPLPNLGLALGDALRADAFRQRIGFSLGCKWSN
jgi:hypothetical protein